MEAEKEESILVVWSKKKSRNPIEVNRDNIGLVMEIGNVYYYFTNPIPTK